MKFTEIYTANVENLDFSVENRLNIVNKQTFSVEKPVNSVRGYAQGNNSEGWTQLVHKKAAN